MDACIQPQLRKLGVNYLFLASEYVPDSMRKTLREIWGCEIRTHYGLTEMGLGVAVECEAQDGYHFNEASLLLEVVNPLTGEPVQEGEEGELVFTTLTREAMPLIRYRTHDISRLMPGPCLCGANSLLKFDKIKKRLESMVTIGCGDAIYPSYFDDVLYGIPGLVDYQIALHRQEGADRLYFKVEMVPGRENCTTELSEKLMSEALISGNVKRGLMEEPVVETVKWGQLQSVGRAKKMIIDRR
jgi:phenylacetate-coenzyme A ligase PaaK-like adenylate-forming protein